MVNSLKMAIVEIVAHILCWSEARLSTWVMPEMLRSGQIINENVKVWKLKESNFRDMRNRRYERGGNEKS